MARLVPSLACLALAAAAVTAPVDAAVVSTDFNDLNANQLQTQGGGTGFAAGSAWTGNTSQVQVVSGNLAAPASTGYSLAQAEGTGRKVRGINVANRVVHRDLAAPLAGEIWGSFLISLPDANANAVLGFNASSPMVDSLNSMQSLSIEGGDLVYRAGATEHDRAATAVPTGENALIVFRIVYSTSDPNKGFSAWVNPDLTAALPEPALFSTIIGNGNVSRLSLGGRGQGEVDAVYLSDDADAFTDVTGREFVVPEPAAAALMSAGAILVAGRNRAQ